MTEEFYKYVSKYDISLGDIKRKYDHSLRVMNLCIKYAKLLNYSDDDIELISIIGLLHDIGRFEQYARYKCYDDFNTVDHGDLGVEVLKENNFISKFTDRVKDYDLILFAIKNHNKFSIEKCNDKRYLKFTKLIRDIDKLDIIYLCGYLGEFHCVANGDLISDKIINDIKNHKIINRKDVLNNNDRLVMFFAFVFDINNDIILREFKQNIYYFYKKIGGTNIFKDVYNIIISYIDERIGKNAREEI